jgi:hypothetical protein
MQQDIVLGVEAGQIAFVLALVIAFLPAGLFLRRLDVAGAATNLNPLRLRRPAGYVVGIFASFWLIDRVAAFMAQSEQQRCLFHHKILI